ncbi:MAG: hypothetical protein JW973_12105 [Bacteroidales bacterium]|nr:hypothetical protein [Bacteroidales bacterium]
MHFVPQSNFLNPAVQQECRLFIGLPVISSVHVNVANSGFTLNQLLEKQSETSYVIDADFVANKLAGRNYLTTEIHTTILAIGVRYNQYYFTFTINEKDNSFIAYPRNLVSLALDGNTQFEGERLSLNSTGVFFNHYREYALGVSKQVNNATTVGVRAKLLFGKLNIETQKMDVSLFTAENTFDLLFDIDTRINASLPYSLEIVDDSYELADRYDAPVMDYIMNRRNPGIALDAGFIYRYTDNIVFSGSVLDLGCIYYRSNLTNYSLRGDYLYDGPLNNSIIDEGYYDALWDSLNVSMDDELTYDSYYHFLDPRLLLGATFVVNPKISVNALSYNRYNKMKFQSGVMLSALIRPVKNLETSLSWSYMNRSALNLGIGIAYGKSPLQLYIVTDNVLAPLFPMSTKNLNIRFGLNIIVGCRRKENIDGCGCYWIREAEKKRARKERLLHK